MNKALYATLIVALFLMAGAGLVMLYDIIFEQESRRLFFGLVAGAFCMAVLGALLGFIKDFAK